MILASDGVWDYMDAQEAVDLMHAYLRGGLHFMVQNKAKADVVERLQALVGVKESEMSEFMGSFQGPNAYGQYTGLFTEGYQYVLSQDEHREVAARTHGVESLAANILGQITLQLAARESGMTIDELKSLPVGSRRRGVHDDTTVVVMYI